MASWKQGLEPVAGNVYTAPQFTERRDMQTRIAGEIIAIGDELTCGRVANSTSRLAARELFLLGYDFAVMQCIGDNPDLIGATLRTAINRADFVLVTGGLGSTDDDLTTAAAARALGLKTVSHPVLEARLRDYLAAQGREGDFARFARFAVLPDGAEPLDLQGRMAGYLLEYQGKPLWFLPGVPSQMAILLSEKLIPELTRRFPQPPVRQHLYHSIGLPELDINARLKPLEGRPGLQIGYYPVDAAVDVSLTVRTENAVQNAQLFTEADTLIRSALGATLFGENSDTLPECLGRLLEQRGLRLVLAESCTGGLIASSLTAIPGSSHWFEGGVVVYSNRLKEQLLGVPAALLADFGAVSKECATALAKGALAHLGGDLALAVTGIAGPSGGSPEKPVGTIFLGLAAQGLDTPQVQRLSLHGSRQEIQQQTMQRALDMLRHFLAHS